MKLEEFLTKWEWLDLKDADETLTGSEQTIWEIMKENQKLKEEVNNLEQLCSICQKEQENDFLKAELEAECKEHQEAMLVADNTIKVLDKALEIACKHIETFSDGCYYCPRKQYCDGKCELNSGENECIDWLMDYFKIKVKELE